MFYIPQTVVYFLILCFSLKIIFSVLLKHVPNCKCRPNPFSTSLTSPTVECFLQTSSETHVPSFCNGGLTSFRRTNPTVKPTDNHQQVPTLKTHGTRPSLPHMAPWQFYIHRTIETRVIFCYSVALASSESALFLQVSPRGAQNSTRRTQPVPAWQQNCYFFSGKNDNASSFQCHHLRLWHNALEAKHENYLQRCRQTHLSSAFG